jgi:hypothetical protein
MNRQAKELTKAMLSTIASLLLSVKNAAIDYQAKLFPFAKAFLGLCLSGLLLVSCASGVSGPKRAGNIWWADYTQNSRGDCSIDGQKMGDYWFNDSKNKTYGYQIPQGEHNVGIGTRWSNGFVDSTQLTLDVKEGRKYTIYMHELQEGQDPNAPVDITREYKDYGGGRAYRGTSGGNWKEDAMQYIFVAGLAYPPLWVLGFALAAVSDIQRVRQRSSQINEANTNPQDGTANMETQPTDSVVETLAQPPDSTLVTETKPEETAITTASQTIEPPPAPTARPFDGCCYVWVEDSETKEVVAGTRLPGAGK